MKRLKKIIGSAFMVMMLCMMMTTVAYAAETDSAWLHVSETSDGKGTEALIAANTTITDGLVKLTYDSTKLTYQDVTVSEAYVAMYAVNAEEAGVVLISWVAPEAYDATDDIVLIQVNFTGTADEGTMELTGKVQDAEGNEIALGDMESVDDTALEEAVAEAKVLEKSDYTEDSFAAVKESLAAAEAVLADPLATQAEVDAAATALNEALDALVDITALKKAIAEGRSKEESRYTEKSFRNMKRVLSAAETVLKDPDATQKEVDEVTKNLNKAIASLKKATSPSSSDSADTGDNANIVLPVVIAVVAVAVIAVAVFMKKRGLAK